MNSNIQCGIKGSYKVDLYEGGGPSRKFIKSTDWFSNDITNVGMNYPFTYPFAQCFMYLSLGSGTYASASNTPYTGLASGIATYQIYDPTLNTIYPQTGQYIGWPGYEIGGSHDTTYAGSLASACGTLFTNQGVNMYRGWTIPTGSFENGNILGQNLTINQFMVSPGNSGDSTGCYAFSLVNRTVVIPSGYTATITYQLSVNFANYSGQYTYFSGVQNDPNGYFSTGNASTGANGSNEIPLLSGWSNLSGIYRQIFPGIQVVDSVGACVIPKMGADLEPSKANCPKTVFYLSPDIGQFAVSKFGGSPTGEYQAYNSCGVMASYSEYVNASGGDLSIHSDSETATAFATPDAWFYSGMSQATAATTEQPILDSIRLTNLLPISNYNTGSTSNLSYQTQSFISSLNRPVAFATPGALGFNGNLSNYGQKAVYSSPLKRYPISTGITATGSGTFQRFKYVTKKATFSPISCYGTNSRYGSLTLAFNSAANSINGADFHPYIDFLFFDNSGRGANCPHYRVIPDIYLTERGSGVSSVRFDITGAGGATPSSIDRIYSVYGFMGQGYDINQHTSGLNPNHPLLTPASIPDTQNNFIPLGDKTSGYLFPGESLGISVQGDYTYNNNTGWGSVYGIVASSGFYESPYDLCVIDNPVWSGFSGGIPNPTGDSSRIFWPVSGSGLGVRITGVSYYVPGLGSVPDPSDFFANGNQNILWDAQNQNLAGFGGNASLFSIANYPLMNITLNGNLAGNGSITDTLSGVFKIGSARITGAILTGLDVNSNYIFSGFRNGLSLALRGSGSGYSVGNITSGGFLGITGGNAGNAYALLYNGNLLNTGDFSLIANNFKKPSGLLHHVEGITMGSYDIGHRLLPNYGTPNNNGVDSYYPVQGGAFPGMSTQNGMEVYLNFSWSGA